MASTYPNPVFRHVQTRSLPDEGKGTSEQLTLLGSPMHGDELQARFTPAATTAHTSDEASEAQGCTVLPVECSQGGRAVGRPDMFNTDDLLAHGQRMS